jgi:hypothetical protein
MDKLQQFLPILFFYLFIAIIVVIILLLLKQNKNVFNNVSDKNYLKSQIKSTGTGYLLLFFFGFHYIYLGRLLLQILYWVTLGGLGIWFVIDLVTLSNRISTHNALLYKLIDDIEKGERERYYAKTMI